MSYQIYSAFCFLIVAAGVSFLIYSINNYLVQEIKESSKASTYECGFQPIDLDLQQFDIKFYVVGLLFLLFDIEIIFLLPFFNLLIFANIFIFFSLLFFMFCFLLTFLYEWKNKFLDWN